MHKDTIVIANADKDIPREYWEKVLEGKPNAYGCAVVENGEITTSSAEDPTVEKLMEIREIFKPKTMVFFVGNLKTPIHEDSLQPFDVQTGADGRPAIVAFMEGDYSTHGFDKQTCSDEFYMAENVLVPLIQQFWELTDGNVEKVMKIMGNKAQDSAVHNASKERGTTVLLATTGELKVYSKNTDDAEYDWGLVTQTCGFGESDYPKKEEPKIEEPKVQTAAEKMAAVMGSQAKSKFVKKDDATEALAAKKQQLTEAILAEAKKEDQVKSNGTGTAIHNATVEAKKTDTAAAPSKTIRLKVPNGSNSEKKDFFRKYMGGTPSNWRKLQSIDVPLELAPVAELPTKPEFKKDTDPKHLPATSVPPTPSLSIPIIPVAQLRDFHNKFMSSVEVQELKAAKQVTVPSAVELQDLEKKFPSFSEQTQVDTIAAAMWPHVAKGVLIREYPDLANSLLHALSIHYLKTYKPPVAPAQSTVPTSTQKVATSRFRR